MTNGIIIKILFCTTDLFNRQISRWRREMVMLIHSIIHSQAKGQRVAWLASGHLMAASLEDCCNCALCYTIPPISLLLCLLLEASESFFSSFLSWTVNFAWKAMAALRDCCHLQDWCLKWRKWLHYAQHLWPCLLGGYQAYWSKHSQRRHSLY